MKRMPLKRGNYRLKRTAFKHKENKKSFEEAIEHAKLFSFFASIWLSLPSGERRCRSCGRELYMPMRSYYFDHLIEKSKRPDLALEKDNIFLCCLSCHSLKTDGHPTEPHREAIEKAKEKFGIS